MGAIYELPEIYTLPTIQFVGGSTETLEINIKDSNNQPFEIQGGSANFSLINFSNKGGTPILSKSGTLIKDNDEIYSIASFNFIPSDTLNLNGKYVYQLTIIDAEGKAEIPNQGFIYIINNINKTFLSDSDYSDTNNYINIKSYGAKGDGNTDDTISIQTCFNDIEENTSIYFPDGTYIVTGILLSTPNIHIYGHGAILKLKASTNASILTLDGSYFSTIQGIIFDGNKTNQIILGDGIVDNRNGIVLKWAFFSTIMDCVISNNCNDGIQLLGYYNESDFRNSDECHIVNNYIQSNQGIGLKVDSVSDFLLDGNNIDFNQSNGCWIGSTTDVNCCNFNITNNNILTNDGVGLDIEYCSRYIITENQIRNNGERGCNLIGGKDITFSNNNVHMNGRLVSYSSGVVVAYNSEVILTGNLMTNRDFTKTQGYGAEFYTVSSCRVSSNIVSENLSSDINVSADCSDFITLCNVGITDRTIS